MKGRFKRYLRERCPECNELLQIREYSVKGMIEGEEVTKYVEYKACSGCEYEEEIEQKRIRRQEEA